MWPRGQFRRCLSIQIALLFGLGGSCPLSYGQKQPLKPARDDIRVRLVPIKRSYILPGEIEARIEIENVSDHDLFICRNLSPWSTGMCAWSFQLEDNKGKPLRGVGVAVDRPTPREPAFASALSKDWIALPRRYVYSTTVDLGVVFPEKTRPGRYRITAQFESHGMQSEGMYNRVQQFPDDVSKLPFPSWRGRVELEPVWIMITTKEEKSN